jgi:hypothetical protein
MAGRVGELLADNVARRVVLIRVLSDQQGGARDELYRELLQTPGVEEARMNGDEVVAEVNGGDQEVCDLLAALVGRGHRVIEFKQQRANLEEIFMSVTKGVVQ